MREDVDLVPCPSLHQLVTNETAQSQKSVNASPISSQAAVNVTLRPPARCPTPFSCMKVDLPSDSRASLVVLSSISGRSQVIVFPRLLVLPDLNPEANPSSATQILHSFFLALLVWAKSLKPVTTEHDIHPTHSYNRHHRAKTARRARHETKTSADRPDCSPPRRFKPDPGPTIDRRDAPPPRVQGGIVPCRRRHHPGEVCLTRPSTCSCSPPTPRTARGRI
jgi:hypothetical protein